jgi:hypothetical protein
MHVLSTWNVPSAVHFSAKLGSTVLVLARASRIEIVRLLEDGLSYMCGTDLWGQITSLRVLNESVCRTTHIVTLSVHVVLTIFAPHSRIRRIYSRQEPYW